MKIFPSSSIKKLDAYTIEHEPIASIDLMERAAQALTKAITERWDITTPVTVFAGPGNNGGDALAVARMLAEKEYKVEAYLFNPKGELSADCQTNKELVEMMDNVKFSEVSTQFVPPALTMDHLVVDGLFGSGLNKPLSGGFAAVVKYINASPATVVAIDIPSGSSCAALWCWERGNSRYTPERLECPPGRADRKETAARQPAFPPADCRH